MGSGRQKAEEEEEAAVEADLLGDLRCGGDRRGGGVEATTSQSESMSSSASPFPDASPPLPPPLPPPRPPPPYHHHSLLEYSDNKIGLLWCHSHVELWLIGVEVD